MTMSFKAGTSQMMIFGKKSFKQNDDAHAQTDYRPLVTRGTKEIHVQYKNLLTSMSGKTIIKNQNHQL